MQWRSILTTAVSAELNTLYPLNMDVQNNIGTKLCYEGLVNYENGEIDLHYHITPPPLPQEKLFPPHCNAPKFFAEICATYPTSTEIHFCTE